MSSPSIAIFGAGGIGTMLAHGLARAGRPVELIARGGRLSALRRDGITLAEGGIEDQQSIAVLDVAETAQAGARDVVVLALKQQQIEPALPSILPLIGSETLIVPAINGIPWWYFEGVAGPREGHRLMSLDARGVLADALPASQILGCVVYLAAEMPSPARVESLGFRKLVFGPVVGDGNNPAIDALMASFDAAGFKVKRTDDIRQEVWSKLWGNIWANPLSVVTQSGMGEMHADPAMRDLGMAMMREAGAVACALGIEMPISPEKRIADAGKFSGFKTSMLQDFERGTTIELDGILGAVLEIGEMLAIDTPTLRIVHILTRYAASRAGAY